MGITPTTELTAEPNPSAGQMSTFTSIGATPDLRIKPELSAVGGNVYSSIPAIEGKGDYASMSGTSMASPYVAGASVLVKSYMAENWTGSYDAASMTENLMMSTASPVVDPETKLPYSRAVCRAAASLTCPPPPPAMWCSTPMPTSTATPSPCWIWGTMLPRTAATT